MKTGRFVAKLLLYLICLLIFCVSIYAICYEHELRLLSEFQALARVDPLPRAKELVAQGEYCEALEYLEYCREYEYVKNDERISQYYKELREERESYLFRLKDAAKGVWKGKGACTESLVSATVSDFLVVGDVRDLVWGAVNEYYGEGRDRFTMALAGAGVLLAGATVGSGGGTAPVKGSVSLLKLAKRMGKLTKPLQDALAKLLKVCVRLKSYKPLVPVSKSLYKISRAKDLTIAGFMTIISRCKSIKDIKVMEKAVSACGKQTAKFMTLGGNTAMDIVRKFHPTPRMGKALDSALEYGEDGVRLLKKTGPSKFLKYLTIAKYGVRTTRTIWKGRLPLLIADLLKRLPMTALFAIAAVTGIVALGAPAVMVRTRFIRRKKPNDHPAA